jgi:hypothetical protein
MDYKELLIKYIAHIIDNESIDYMDRYPDGDTAKLTSEERAELEMLANEARARYNP